MLENGDLLKFATVFSDNFAVLSPDRNHRYWLSRKWNARRPTLTMIVCNPSVGNEARDDGTTLHAVVKAERLGFGALQIVSLFSMVAIRPRDSVFFVNDDEKMQDLAYQAVADKHKEKDAVVASWGHHGRIAERAGYVTKLFQEQFKIDLHTFGLSSNGKPRHVFTTGNKPLTLWRKAYD